MAIIKNVVQSNEIEKILNDLFGEYHDSLREMLNINLEYKVNIKPVKYNDGSIDSNILASCISRDYKSVDEMVFFVDTITDMMNLLYGAINDREVFVYSIKINVYFIFLHELVHIHQIINGLSLTEYSAVHYSENQWEDEANNCAAKIIGEKGIFEKEIIKVARGLTRLDNNNVQGFIRLYYEQIREHN